MSQSNMENRLSAAEGDVERVIAECVTCYRVATERSYAAVLRSYCVFHGLEVDSCSQKFHDRYDVNAQVDPVVVALATIHKDPKSFSGYIEAALESVTAAGLAAGVAANSSRRRIRFVAGIDLYLPSEVLDVDSSLSSCSSLAVCIPVSNVQENIVVPDLANKDPKSFLGYIEAAPESVTAAGLAAGVAANSSRRRIRFVAGIDLYLPSEVLDVDSSLSSCSSSS